MPENTEAVAQYAHEVLEAFFTGHAKEHGYRPQLAKLLSSFDDALGVNDPKRSTFGNPDFVIVKRSNNDIILGYAEAKDIDVDLNKTVDSEQLRRYAGYDKLFLTNYHEFRFFRNGEEYTRTSIGKYTAGSLQFNPNSYAHLYDELRAFLELPPEKIKSGRRLAEIMGGKARRIRDNVNTYLNHEDNENNRELEKIYEMMKDLLVHDLSKEKFADMYAQTLVYGLFVARYNDPTPDSFSRSEARDLVPASNPFLREFFDHIVGPRFDKRLSYIVDELCEVFSVSNVQNIVHKHLRLFEVENEKDPIIHFYEDFLKEYDPAERKKMGAYYTPVPVVKFIIKSVDEILKKDFGLTNGLADTTKRTVTIERQGIKRKVDVHKVQILDPAVGTATFLNEIIKYIRETFEGQEGRWPSYAEQDLIPRLYGFELMMAPYTIAHLKLGMTLQESGVKDFKQRLGVYLTNTLEEGIKVQQDLFTFGLAEVVSHEASEAEKIKSEKPIMVIVGNPPYSVSSNNKSEFARQLVKPYKEGLDERKINLDDDYIKFIAFAEKMVSKNGSGIVGMITNNSYLDGPTHRQMRKHLLKTFDKILVLDLHGNAKKREATPDGSKDENVFNIMQGVAIILMVKTGTKKSSELGEVYHTDLYGTQKHKFSELAKNNTYKKITADEPRYYFVPKDFSLQEEYDRYIKINELFRLSGSGIQTDRDSLFIDSDKKKLANRIERLLTGQIDDDFIEKYSVVDSSSYKLTERIKKCSFDENKITPLSYRPFDYRFVYYDNELTSRAGYKSNKHLLKRNIGLVVKQGWDEISAAPAFVVSTISDRRGWSRPGMQGAEQIFPLYINHDDGSHTVNFNPDALKRFTKRLTNIPAPEEILDYSYAALNSTKYRKKYTEFVRVDFPRIPIPENDEHFSKLAALGNRLRKLHLMEFEPGFSGEVTYPEYGGNFVEKVEYSDDKVWINSSQYFGNVPEIAWGFYIGGYQPAQKWLKDRKGKLLTNQEIEHYEKIIKVLVETDEVMKEIDKAWQP
jgi:predicted helicase